MKYTTPKIVQPGGQQVWLWVLLVILLILGVGWNAYQLGREDSGASLPDFEAAIAKQRKLIEDLTRERDGLLEKTAALEQAGLIDRESNEDPHRRPLGPDRQHPPDGGGHCRGRESDAARWVGPYPAPPR